MKIGNINNNCSFGRALTTNEKKEYQKTIADARKVLGTDKTIATVFDFSVPSTKKDTGIGTTFSDDAQKMLGMLKTMCGVNGVQLQPQGQISNFVRSPYSGTGFSLGEHIIDLTKLSDDKYGKLLTEEDLNSSYMDRISNHEVVVYDNVFAQDGQKAMLQKAFDRFEELDETSPLKKEFKQFQKDNEYWLRKDALFEAMGVANGSKDMRTWSDRDKNVFATKEGDEQRIRELEQVTDEKGNNVVDYEEFVQFIADKQQKESKANFNAQGIDVYGDCQIGFSDKDFWAHKYAFFPNYEFGCKMDNNSYSCWSPAINFYKLDAEAGELLYNKFDLFFKRYDGVRIDAAWQLINPLICEPLTENGNPVFDHAGNKLGKLIDMQPQIKNGGKEIIENIVMNAADKNGVKRDKVLLELLGGNSYDSLDAVKGLGGTLIHISRYGNEGWGRVKYYESHGSNKYQNMAPEDYIMGPGTHDDPSLIEQVEDWQNRENKANYLSRDLGIDRNYLLHSPENTAAAVYGEMFTTNNQFATLPDILGSRRKINTPNTTDGNWSYRAPQNYEKEYFTNLSKNKGLNTPDAMAKALQAKSGNYHQGLIDKLYKFANILRSDGPMTTEEADKYIG